MDKKIKFKKTIKKIKLTEKEKYVLHECCDSLGFKDWIADKYLGISEDDVEKTLNKLFNLGLVIFEPYKDKDLRLYHYLETDEEIKRFKEKHKPSYEATNKGKDYLKKDPYVVGSLPRKKILTSLTLENFFPEDLSIDIINYLRKNDIKKVKIKISEELKEPTEKIYFQEDFEKLKKEIEDSLNSEGRRFSITLPKIKTSWEEFTYGVEANSYEEDFKRVFAKYERKITNTFGEEIEEDFIEKVAEKLIILDKNKIDGLWAKTGWKESGKGKNKSLPNWRLEKIREDIEFAKGSLANLFQETPKEEFIKIFEYI